MNISIIGHPFVQHGVGEQCRSHLHAAEAVSLKPNLINVYDLPFADQKDVFDDYKNKIAARNLPTGTGDIELYHINADEVENALAALEGRINSDAYRIICPAWELAEFPLVWLKQLDKFDEVWAFSQFIKDSISNAGFQKPIHLILQSAERIKVPKYGRSHLNLPEGAFIFLASGDMYSFYKRKNLEGTIEAFTECFYSSPEKDIRLVLKISNGKDFSNDTSKIVRKIKDLESEVRDRIIFMDTCLNDDEMKSLLMASDSIISLHRAEGFGRLTAEALVNGIPAISTAYSGSLTFTSELSELLVPYHLCPVNDGEYIHFEGQQWAEPDKNIAGEIMTRLVNDFDFYKKCSRKCFVNGTRYLTRHSVGASMLRRFHEIRTGQR